LQRVALGQRARVLEMDVRVVERRARMAYALQHAGNRSMGKDRDGDGERPEPQE
jgi:hypothetical protein